LKSVPVGLLILDELDEMTQKNIPLALERTAGQLEKNIWMCSTPTLEMRGINTYFRIVLKITFSLNVTLVIDL